MNQDCYKCASGWCSKHGMDVNHKMPGDPVMIYGKRYTLLEKNSANLWLVIETDNPTAAPVLKEIS